MPEDYKTGLSDIQAMGLCFLAPPNLNQIVLQHFSSLIIYLT